jgi:DNA-binding SARP family transcriptional activator/tetratricopeptide (TPR) repeat protein
VEWCILGPLRVADNAGREIPIPAGRVRVVLTALLTRSNQVVSVDELGEVLWDGTPQPGAARTVRVYVVRLRHALGPVAAARIITQAPGYLCEAEADEVDVLRFEELCRRGRVAAREQAWVQATELLSAALGLWRGQPLADVPSDLLRSRELPRFEQLHLQAIEDHLDAEMHMGRHEHLIPRLSELTVSFPLREHLHAQLMRALARAGRRAEALSAYQHVRLLLNDELGVEPGPELRDLHQRILAGDSELDAIAAVGVPSAPASVRAAVPRQLPAATRHFTGRRAELDVLTSLLAQPDESRGTVVISAIDGMAGIGKTALAVHWAHQVASEFPDGQLFVNLRGFDPSGLPAAAEGVVRDFLGALGVPPAMIPASAEAQAALYRTVLASRRVLIVLDNAYDADQVRLLLPGSSGCFVLVTSRARQVSLAASEGAHLLNLDVPSVSEARELLSRRLGTGLVAAEPEAAGELIRLCARLPLALGIVAARAAASPGIGLAELANELGDTVGRLDALDAATPARGVRAAFSWSYGGLSDAAARMFRLLGIHPGPDISAATAASLVGVPRLAARSALQELAQAGLIVQRVPGRYALHDLVLIFAAEQAEAEGAEQSGVAFRRLLEHYLRTGYGAALALNRHRAPITLPTAQPGVMPEEVAEYDQAVAWFETERQGLEAAIVAAADARLDLYAWQLAWTLTDFLNWRGYWHNHIAILGIALAATQRLGESAGESSIHRGLARAFAQLDRLSEAVDHLHQSLAICRKLADLVGQGHAHMGLAVVTEQQGRIPESLDHGQHALDLYRRGHHQPGEAAALNAIGWCRALLGQYEQASDHSEQALALYQMLGDQVGAAYSWDTLGYVHRHLGDYSLAEACYQSALELFRDLGIAYSTADTLIHLGDTYRQTGDIEAARNAWEQALSVLRDLDHPHATDVQAKLTDLMTTGRTA